MTRLLHNMAAVGKLRFRATDLPRQHRSGWPYALTALEPLQSHDGIVTDTFLESTFAWHLKRERASGIVPYRTRWIGFLHNPVGIPRWHEYYSAPAVMFELPEWLASRDNCAGIITLSEDLAAWVRLSIRAPVLAVVHPTETPALRFTFDEYRANRNPLLLQVGFWLRRFTSIYKIHPTRLTRAILNPVADTAVLERAIQLEIRSSRKKIDRSEVLVVPFAADNEYDLLLSRNVVFLDLFDCAAVNVLIECIVRDTPVLVRDLPATREYLGDRYPLFFRNLSEAESKVNDTARIQAAHDYLRALDKQRFSPDVFRNSIVQSDLYRSL